MNELNKRLFSAEARPGHQHDRRTFIGSSDLYPIMKGDLRSVWLEKTGRTEPVDLSNEFRVQLGLNSEPFILDWVEKLYFGKMPQNEGARAFAHKTFDQHPEYLFLCAECDAMYAGDLFGGASDYTIVEAKHSNGWADDQSIIDSYYAQVQHQMFVHDVDVAAIAYIKGNQWGGVLRVEADPLWYEGHVLPILKNLWQHIVEDTEPEAGKAPPPPPKLDDLIVYDLNDRDPERDKSNWIQPFKDAAVAATAHRPAALAFDEDKATLSSLVPDDARKVLFGEVEARRIKTGKIQIHFSKGAD